MDLFDGRCSDLYAFRGPSVSVRWLDARAKSLEGFHFPVLLPVNVMACQFAEALWIRFLHGSAAVGSSSHRWQRLIGQEVWPDGV